MTTLPTIHHNGNSREQLLEQYQNTYKAACELTRLFNQIDLHPRNYYPQGAGAFRQAEREAFEQRKHIGAIKTYLEAHLIHLAP